MYFNKGLIFFVLFLVCSIVPAGAMQLQNNFTGELKDSNMFEGKGWACQIGHDLQLLGDRTIADGDVVTQTCLDSNVMASNCALLSIDNTEGNMVLSLSGSAIDSTTGNPLNISQKISLDNGVDWVSVVYKNPEHFKIVNDEVVFNPNMDLEIIVNGKVVLRKSVYNTYAKDIPQQWVKKYPNVQWNALEYIYFLNFHNNTKEAWNIINNDTILNKDDKCFIRDYHNYFKDSIDLSVSYPEGSVKRSDRISYMNGIDIMPDPKNPRLTDFELVQSFAVTKEKVTHDQLKYWLDEQNKYSTSNYMKAAYGTFLTALMVIGCHDSIAEKIAANFEVNWNRNQHTMVMNGITQQQTYIHTTNASMGMNIKGDNNSIKAFRYACSSILSPIEDKILKAEAFPVNSVLLGTGQKLMNGTVINIEEQDNNVLIHAHNDNNTKILIESDTYLVKEMIGSYKGSTSTVPAYCYHDMQTRLATTLGNNIINNNCNWLGTLGGLATTIGATITYMTIKGTIPPDKQKIVLGLALGLGGLVMQAKEYGILKGDWNPNSIAKFLVSAAISVIPLYGTEGGTVGELIISYVGKDGLKREVTHVPANFEGYVITTMKVRPGDAFKGSKNLEPIYFVSAQYIKYGTSEAVLKTAVGKTPQEAIREFIKSNTIQEGSNIIIDTYNPDKDAYTSIKYNNIQEYLKK
jgi:hypothetical protein